MNSFSASTQGASVVNVISDEEELAPLELPNPENLPEWDFDNIWIHQGNSRIFRFFPWLRRLW